MEPLEISYKKIRTLAFFFLFFPVLLFLLFFVRFWISIPAAVLLTIAMIRGLGEETDSDQSFTLSRTRLAIFAIICAVWCYLGGQGGLFFQTSDWNERNAIFRDLITRPWPVLYDATDTALTYYIGHWLPAAIAGKGLYLLTNNTELAFGLGNIFLGLWTLFGVLVTMLLLFCGAGAKSKKTQWIVFAVFLGFSGLDIIGCLVREGAMEKALLQHHLEWWADRYQFSSSTTCLFWVFNQAVTAWIATLCFFNEKNNRSYAFIICCSLLSASLPCVGLAILMLGRVACQVYSAIRAHSIWKYVKRTFSFTNVASAVCLVPIMGAYLLSNSAFEKTVASEGEAPVPVIGIRMWLLTGAFAAMAVVLLVGSLYLRKKGIMKGLVHAGMGCAMLLAVMTVGLCATPGTNRTYFLFLMLECGLYWLLVAWDYHDDPLLYLTGIVLIISPLIRVGIGADFCMRASLPALMLLLLMCAKKLASWAKKDPDDRPCKIKRITCWLLVLCLLIGAATPVMEVYRGVYMVTQEGAVVLPADEIKTLNKYHSSGGIYGNFVAENYENSLFFRFFARQK